MVFHLSVRPRATWSRRVPIPSGESCPQLERDKLERVSRLRPKTVGYSRTLKGEGGHVAANPEAL